MSDIKDFENGIHRSPAGRSTVPASLMRLLYVKVLLQRLSAPEELVYTLLFFGYQKTHASYIATFLCSFLFEDADIAGTMRFCDKLPTKREIAVKYISLVHYSTTQPLRV